MRSPNAWCAIEAQQRARDEYPERLAAWQEHHRQKVDAIEARIAYGERFTDDQIKQMIDEIWSSKPEDPAQAMSRLWSAGQSGF